MVTNIVFDAILVLIVVIGFIVGIKNGFIKTVAKPVKLFLSIFMAFSWCESVGSALIKPWISAPLTGKLSAYITELCDGLAADAAASEMPTLIKVAASICGIDLGEVATGTGEALAESIVLAITDPFVGIISSILAFIAIYIVAKLVLGLLVAIIDKVSSDGGFVDVVNKLLGAVIMLAFSFLVSWGLVAIFDFVLHTPVFAEQAWVQEFTGGWIFNLLKSISPLEILLSF